MDVYDLCIAISKAAIYVITYPHDMVQRDEMQSAYFSNRNILSILQHGMTALFAAAQEGHRDIATLLLEGGAQVNLQTNVSVWKDNKMGLGQNKDMSHTVRCTVMCLVINTSYIAKYETLTVCDNKPHSHVRLQSSSVANKYCNREINWGECAPIIFILPEKYSCPSLALFE